MESWKEETAEYFANQRDVYLAHKQHKYIDKYIGPSGETVYIYDEPQKNKTQPITVEPEKKKETTKEPPSKPIATAKVSEKGKDRMVNLTDVDGDSTKKPVERSQKDIASELRNKQHVKELDKKTNAEDSRKVTEALSKYSESSGDNNKLGNSFVLKAATVKDPELNAQAMTAANQYKAAMDLKTLIKSVGEDEFARIVNNRARGGDAALRPGDKRIYAEYEKLCDILGADIVKASGYDVKKAMQNASLVEKNTRAFTKDLVSKDGSNSVSKALSINKFKRYLKQWSTRS